VSLDEEGGGVRSVLVGLELHPGGVDGGTGREGDAGEAQAHGLGARVVHTDLEVAARQVDLPVRELLGIVRPRFDANIHAAARARGSGSAARDGQGRRAALDLELRDCRPGVGVHLLEGHQAREAREDRLDDHDLRGGIVRKGPGGRRRAPVDAVPAQVELEGCDATVLHGVLGRPEAEAVYPIHAAEVDLDVMRGGRLRVRPLRVP
jgi:hypothetical protein